MTRWMLHRLSTPTTVSGIRREFALAPVALDEGLRANALKDKGWMAA